MTPNERFIRCEAVTVTYEGGWSNNPLDKGGPTYKGVTLPALTQFLGRPATVAELHGASDQLIAAVYHTIYWPAVRGDELAPGVDMMLFDAAVHSGRKRAVSFAQIVLGITVDGVPGDQTMAAIAAVNDRVSFVKRLAAEREHWLRGLSDFQHFGTGWIRRVDGVTAKALAWAQGA